MSTEKTPALYVPNDAFDEKKPKNKFCSNPYVYWVTIALLIALLVALCLQLVYPAWPQSYKSSIDVVEIYDGKPIPVRFPPRSGKGETFERTTDEPWHFDFLINPTRLCDTVELPDSEVYKMDPEVKLLMLVPSATDHFAQRKAIRKTWGSIADKPHGPMRLGFVLGTTLNTTEQGMISNESETFGDIIQANFEDTYRNLTTKSVLMLKWVSKQCPHAQYVLKTDDDTFVNLSILDEVLQKFAPGERFISGFIHRGAQPFRGPGQKYFVSESDYPYEEYPPYISGSAYVTTGSTASQLFEASKDVKPLLPMEDVYVTGLCAEEIAAELLHEPCFRYQELSQPSSLDGYSSLATIHSVSPDDMDKLWNDMTKIIFDALAFPDENFFSSMDTSTESKSVFDFFNLLNTPKVQAPTKNLYFSSLDSNSNSKSIFDLSSDLSPQGKGASSDSSWMTKTGESRLLNLLLGNLGAPSSGGIEANSNYQISGGSQGQQNLPRWPGSQSSGIPFQDTKLQMPLSWQKTFIFPLPLNRIGGNGFNLTEFQLK